MSLEFFTALQEKWFLQNALATGLLASVACGVVGTYVVTRRITYIAGGIAHSVLAGLAAAGYLRAVHGWEAADPVYGAVIASLIAALIIGFVTLRAREREDTVIGAVWAIGMAIGVVFLELNPTSNQDLMGYLFGDILMVDSERLAVLAVLDVILLVTVALLYKQFLAVCFDSEFARLRGVQVDGYYLLLLCLTALTVVILTTVVGLVMVIALLTLPVAIAGQFARTLAATMLLASLLSAAFTTGGLALSYGPDLPAGATTILLAGTAYIGVLVIRRRTAASQH